MKKTQIIFWITTLLISGYMVYSAIPGIQMTDKTIGVFSWLGYPSYFIPMISWAKIAGVVAILLPVKGLRTVKEWAYAGLFFDLAGAMYSLYQVMGFFTDMLWFFVLPIIVLFISYFFWRKNENSIAPERAGG